MTDKYRQTYLYVPPAMEEVAFIASGDTEEEEVNADFKEKVEAWKNGEQGASHEDIKNNTGLEINEDRWKASEGKSKINTDRTLHQIVLDGCVVLDCTEDDEVKRKKNLQAELENRATKQRR